MADKIDQIETQLFVAVRRSRRLSQESADSVHPGLELSAYGFLTRLDLVGPSRPSDLAAFLRIGKATAGRQLAALEELGLIDRQPDPADGRAQLLALTALGAQRLQTARATRRRILHDKLADWTEADVVRLAELLHRLNTAFGD